MAGPVTSNCAAISPEESSSSRTSRRIARRRGSAIALRARSTPIVVALTYVSVYY